LALAAVHVLIGVGMAVVGNSEGRVGGFLFALMYALPLALIALALRSSKRRRRATAGWAALLLSVFYSAVVAGNWSGYSTPQAIFMVGVTAPTVAVTLAGFWATVLNAATGLRRPQS
jgi:hypothetical protein